MPLQPTDTTPQAQPPSHETNENTPDIGGGIPVIEYWAKHTLFPEGPKLWKTLFHHSACLSCSWGTGGQKGGFTNEEGEKLQRRMKSVEAISAEIQPLFQLTFLTPTQSPSCKNCHPSKPIVWDGSVFR
ncbi:hypothetical protein NDI45_24535 [Leptolyngbya sp. GB1-A1]|nr:hypothetical protein [Leptolyngbya sp. FACHB-711]